MPSSKPMQIWSSPGRGRKQCRECSVYVASRSHTCRCGFDFTAKEKICSNKVIGEVAIKVLVNPPPGAKVDLGDKPLPKRKRIHPRQAFRSGLDAEETVLQDERPILFAPAGPCPVTLMGPGSRDVKSWVNDLTALHPGLRLAPECFLVWLASFFPRDTPRFLHAAHHVRNEVPPVHARI